jgi:hypothetical protein
MIRGGLQQKDWEGPTWFPDMSNLPPTNPIRRHRASAESEAVYHLEGDVLEIHGALVGTVSRVALLDFNIQTRPLYVK